MYAFLSGLWVHYLLSHWEVYWDRSYEKEVYNLSMVEYLDILPGLHTYNINHEGSSGSMEAKLALKLTTYIFVQSDGHFHVGHRVTNDDSTMIYYIKN